MYEPRRVEDIDSDEEDIEILKTEISKLQEEIDAMDINDISIAKMSEDDMIKILETENTSLKEFIEFEQKRKEELEDELKTISDYVAEEENVQAAVKDFMKKGGNFKMEAAHDEEKAFNHKLEALIIRLCYLIKSFAHKYDCDNSHSTDQPSSSKRGKRTHAKSEDNKSLEDILKLLIPDLKPGAGDVEMNKELEIDHTVNNNHIQFLLSANIIERCSDNPNKVKLVEQIYAGNKQ